MIKAYRELRASQLEEFIRSLFTAIAWMANEHFPEIRGGGSLILAWQIRNKRVLVVGGGEVNNFITLGDDCI